MTTIPKSVKLQLDADWTGAGGAEPTLYLQEEDFRTPPPLGEDSIWIMSKSLDTGDTPFNDTYVIENHVLRLIVNTAKVTGGADRLKEISDEAVRILNATAIADIDIQRMRNRNREITQNKGIWVFQEVITYDLRENLKASAAAHGAGTTGDFAVVGDLTVGDDADITDDLNVGGELDVTGDANFQSDLTDGTDALSIAELADLLMFGSANAAWVPCPFEGAITGTYSVDTNGRVTNTGAADFTLYFSLPLPPTKGGLKLYITGTRVSLSDADADDYVSTRNIWGMGDTGITAIDTNTDDINSIDLHEDTTMSVDASPYNAVKMRLVCGCTDAGELEIQFVTLRCYYDT